MHDALAVAAVTDPFESLTASDRDLYDGLLFLEHRVGARPGEPFQTTRAAMIVESNLRGLTADCSLYKLERAGLIRRIGKPGRGTTVTILQRPR